MNLWWLCAAVAGCVYIIILFAVVWRKVFEKEPEGYSESGLDKILLSKNWNRVLCIGAMFVVLVIETALLNMIEVTFWKGLLLVLLLAFSVIVKWFMVVIVKLIALFFYYLYWNK